MSEPHESEEVLATPFSDVARLRRELDRLHRVVRLVVVAMIIATAGLCLYMYRQTKLLQFQIMAQQAAVIEADKRHAPILTMLPVFQRIGGRYPDYASNVLQKFSLPALAPDPTGSPHP